jgi:Xaa-Pro aminopeptidase
MREQYNQRLQKLQALLNEANCDACVIDNKINLFYLTGLSLSSGTLFIHKENSCLLVDNRYYELCQQSSPVSVKRSEEVSLLKLLQSGAAKGVKRLAFDSENTSHKSFLDLEKLLHKVNESSPSGINIALHALDNPVKRLRMIKDASEIEQMRLAAKLGSEGYDFVSSLLKEGITESEIASQLEIFWKQRGSQGIAFEPIIAFGANSSMPHYRAGEAKLKSGQAVLIDIGVNFKHYHSDMTRVIFFGIPHPKMAEIYEVVREAQTLALKECRPGILIGALDQAARDYITSKGYGGAFTHGLGHGVGLEIHEAPGVTFKPPYNAIPLQAGMVITIEPGIYLPGIGGVRIEDTVVITPEGYENLTNRSKELKVINIDN